MITDYPCTFTMRTTHLAGRLFFFFCVLGAFFLSGGGLNERLRIFIASVAEERGIDRAAVIQSELCSKTAIRTRCLFVALCF